MADVLPNESEIEAGSPSKGDIPEKPRAIDDMEDPDTQRDMQRPANIRFDMKEMERNKRVSLILNSQAFREELEAIIDSQLKQGFNPNGPIQMLTATSPHQIQSQHPPYNDDSQASVHYMSKSGSRVKGLL